MRRPLRRGSHTTSTPAGNSSSRTRPGAEKPDFDDSKWDTVSTPHTYNDVDSFDEIISRRAAEKTVYTGPACYRKHFKLPADAQGNKVFIEFEGMRQAGRFFVNGKAVGKYENGVTPCGIDITDAVNFGDKENVLTVKVTNGNDLQGRGHRRGLPMGIAKISIPTTAG